VTVTVAGPSSPPEDPVVSLPSSEDTVGVVKRPLVVACGEKPPQKVVRADNTAQRTRSISLAVRHSAVGKAGYELT